MATAKKTASPVAKTAAAKPAAKSAPAAKTPAAKTATAAPVKKPAAVKKAAAAPVAPVIEQGSVVRFLGYDESVPEDQRILNAGDEIVVHEVADDGKGNAVYIIRIDNPDFNAKKKENPETNPKEIETELFAEEVEFVAASAEELEGEAEAEGEAEGEVEGEAAEGEGEAAEGEEAGEAEAETAAEEAPAPTTKRAAATAKTAPAKTAPTKTVVKGGKKEVKPVLKTPAIVEDAEEDTLPDLENEDADVVALVSENEDLVALAQNLESDIGTTEYRIGGVLYHIKKSGSYKDLDPTFKEKKGFAAFLSQYMNIEYRKAMYLIEIYVNFNLAGIENAAERVAAIGWTKASKIAKLLNVDGQNPEELLTLAAESTVPELSEAITVQNVRVGGTAGEKKKRVMLKFSYFEDEGTGIADIIKGAMEQHGLQTEAEALALIVNEWATQSGGAVQADIATAPVQSAPVGVKKATAKPAVKKAAPVAKAA